MTRDGQEAPQAEPAPHQEDLLFAQRLMAPGSQAGCDQAWAEFVGKHWKQFVGVVYRFNRPHGIDWENAGVCAKHALEDIFIARHKILGAYEGEAKLTTFLHRVVCWRSLDCWLEELKGRDRTSSEVEVEALEEVPEPKRYGPTEVAEHRERTMLVSEVLDSIGEECRRLLSLRYISGLDHNAIRKRLGIGQDRLKNRLRTCRELFRRTWLARYGEPIFF